MSEARVVRAGDGETISAAGVHHLFKLTGEGVTAPCVGDRLTAWPVEVRDGEMWTA